MTVLTMGKADEGFLMSEENAGRSREVIDLKAGSAYEAGSVLLAEYEESVAESGNFDTATGVYVLATNALVTAYDTLDAVVLARAVDATDASEKGVVIARDAQVKDTELVLGASTTVANVTAALKANGIIVRAAI